VKCLSPVFCRIRSLGDALKSADESRQEAMAVLYRFADVQPSREASCQKRLEEISARSSSTNRGRASVDAAHPVCARVSVPSTIPIRVKICRTLPSLKSAVQMLHRLLAVSYVLRLLHRWRRRTSSGPKAPAVCRDIPSPEVHVTPTTNGTQGESACSAPRLDVANHEVVAAMPDAVTLPAATPTSGPSWGFPENVEPPQWIASSAPVVTVMLDEDNRAYARHPGSMLPTTYRGGHA
jgi:hypothetical protein